MTLARFLTINFTIAAFALLGLIAMGPEPIL